PRAVELNGFSRRARSPCPRADRTRRTMPVAQNIEPASRLWHTKIHRIEDIGAHVVAMPSQLTDQRVKAMPVPELNDILQHDPSRIELARKVENIVGSAPAFLASRLRAFRRAVVRALWRSEQK